MIEEGSRVRRIERVASRVVDGCALLVVIDGQQLHTLNAVGTRVWELCDGRSVTDIAEALAREFDVEPSRALSDVTTFVEDLRAKGAVIVEGVP